MPVYRTLNRNFFKTWTPEMAYVLGFFAADGSMYTTKRKTHFIEFHITDLEILEYIKASLGSNHKISVRRYLSNPKWKLSYRLQLGSKELFDSLLFLGMLPAKSKIISFPKVPADFLSHFIRGYFDGDGSVFLGRYWRKDRNKWKHVFQVKFTSGSKQFLEGLRGSLGNRVKGGYLGEKKGGYELAFAQKDGLVLFEFMYNNARAGSFLERKHNVFLKALKTLNAGVV